jgi:circadian clock protein KaiB
LDKFLSSQLFKGIALFTPGGDLIYGIDPTKQGHWHLHLCASLQEILKLPEPPHFLVPGYTATIDRWLDPRTQKLRQSAELYPLVGHHQPLLNAVFNTGNLVWQFAPWQEALCDPIMLETYRQQFPQLWEDHDLIVRFERSKRLSDPYLYSEESINSTSFTHHAIASGVHSQGLTTMELYSKASPQEPDQNDGADQEAIAFSIEKGNDSKFGRLFATEKAVYRTPPRHEINSSSGLPSILPTEPQTNSPDSYVLRLFVSGHSTATENTLKILHELLETSLPYPYTLKIIDVFKHPDQAEANQISATPTLVRVWPQPVRRLVGDLTNVERVLQILSKPES